MRARQEKKQKSRSIFRRFGKSTLLVLLIVVLGVVVRFYQFPDTIYFGYDQARDAFLSQDIYKTRNITLIGPASSEPGLFHGPLPYYILGFLYLLSGGEPAFVALVYGILGCLSIISMYIFVRTLSNSSLAGIIAALLTAFAYEQVKWSLLLSNITLANVGFVVLITGLALWWFGKKPKASLLAAVGLAVAIQSVNYFLYLFLPIAISYLFLRKTVPALSPRLWVGVVAFVVLGCASYAITEVRFNAPVLHILMNRVTHVGATVDITVPLGQLLNRIAFISFYNVVGFSLLLAFLVVVGSLISLYAKSHGKSVAVFLTIWLFSQGAMLLAPLGFPAIYHLSLGVGFICIAVVSIALTRWLHPILAIGIAIGLALSQLFMVHNDERLADVSLVRKDLVLGQERKVVQYIAQDSGNEQASIYAITVPFNVHTTWAYLFSTYWPKEKPLPVWITNFAKGFPGERVFEENFSAIPCTYYVITEPTHGLPGHMLGPVQEHEAARSRLVEKRTFGEIAVEKRHKFECGVVSS